MAKIGEENSHTSLNINHYFRLPIMKLEENSFLVNDGKKTVVKIKEKKQMHSWTLPHPNAFTCPIISDGNGLLYCVQNSKTLLKWSVEDESLKNAVKFKFKESAFAVLSVSGKEPVVLFESGNAVSIEKSPSGEHSNQKFLLSKESIIWADTSVFQSNTYVVFLSKNFREKNKGKTFKLHSYVLNEENSISNYSFEVIQQDKESLKNWCFENSTLTFSSLWSSGKIQNFRISSKERTTLLSITDVRDSCLFAMDYADQNNLALVRYNAQSKEIVLELWDVLFATLKGKKILNSASISEIQLLVIDSTIFLSYNEELLELSFYVEKSTLATAAGKTISHSRFNPSWIKGKVTVIPDDEKIVEMDTSEKEDLEQVIAQKMMKDGPSYIKYISESDLVKLLRFAVRQKMSGTENSSNIEPSVILASIFASSFSDIFLEKLMKKNLNSDEALVTLEILQSLLKDKSSLSNGTEVLKFTDLQIFNWICLVIQSHMETILLSKDKKCIKLMKQLDKLLLEKMEEYKEYESIQEMVFTLGEEKMLPEKYVDSRYCIETLDT